MKKVAITIILICAGYFGLGWVAVLFGWMEPDTYFRLSGPIGGLASVGGILGVVGRRFSASELKAAELEALEHMVDATKQLKEYEQRVAATEGRIQELRTQQQRMELLVQKASLSLFFQNRYVALQVELLDIVDRDKRLGATLREIRELEAKIGALEEEIDADPDVADIRRIISDAEAFRSEQTTDPLVLVLRDTSRMIRRLILPFS